MPSAGERSLGAYRLVSQLAVGGMAEIYTAKTAGVGGFEKLVALKVIHPNFSEDPDFVQMLVDEAKLTVQLQHPNIVQTFDLGRVDGQYYIAMELVDGADLYKLLRRASEREMPFPIEVACLIAHEACQGLDYAHRKRDSRGRPLEIVHRDVSPQNILVSFDGDVKIADFGIAKAARRMQQTAAGVIKGKYYYMSPEQAWGDPVDARTDVFSAGILLWEMLVGQMLYLEENMDILLDKVRKAQIPSPLEKRPDTPAGLEAIVMKALAKRPQDRYPSAGDFGTALARFMRTRAPDFGRAKLAQWVRSVLEEPTDKPREKVAAMRRDQIPQDRNSLLFKLSEAQQRRPSQPPAVSPPTAVAKGRPSATSARPPSGESPRPILPKPARPVSATSGSGPTAAGTKPAPAAPRRGDRATSPVELPEQRRAAPARAPRNDFEDESDATIVDSDRRFSERQADEGTRPMMVANLQALSSPGPVADDPALDGGGHDADSHDEKHEHEEPTTDRTDLGSQPSTRVNPSYNLDSGVRPLARREPGAPQALIDPVATTAPVSANRPARSMPRSFDEETVVEAPVSRAAPEPSLLHSADDPTGPRRAPEPTPGAPATSNIPSWMYSYREGANAGTTGGTAPPAILPDSYLPPPRNAAPAPAAGSELAWSASKEKSSPELRQSLRPRSRLWWIILSAGVLGGAVAFLPQLVHKPPPLRGTLEIVSLPTGAELQLDGKPLSQHTPVELGDLDPALSHTVLVSLHGYQNYQSEVHFDAATPRVRLQAILVSNLGELELRSSPTGAEVLVNGRARGVTPLTVGELPVDKPVDVVLRLRGHKEAHRTYTFTGAQSTQRRIEASVPLDRSR